MVRLVHCIEPAHCVAGSVLFFVFVDKPVNRHPDDRPEGGGENYAQGVIVHNASLPMIFWLE